MACYSYTTGLPVLYNNNVEVVLAKSGTTYSYNSLMWICELSVSDQLKVFTRPTPTGTETLRIENTDYTISGTNIVFTNAALIPDGGEVVIRRSTRSDKMVLRFTDGAKLAAKDLNDCFHQLLFTIQEKEFEGSTIVYGESGNIQFINASPPYTFNLANLTPGKALVWNGTQFVADTFTGTLDALSDVTISSATPGDLLIYNGTQWVDQAPSFDITQSNVKLANRAFYNNVNTGDTSYVSSGVPVTAPGALSVFKRTSPTADWVLTDPPTVYHIIKKSLPGEEDPITFFADVDSQLTSLAANVANPVKAKFEWRLNIDKSEIIDTNTGDSLINAKTMFWESPSELYDPTGYAANNGILYHGVFDVVNGVKYRDSAFYRRNLNGSNVQLNYKSKIWGYNIRNFYLSIPESVSTNLSIEVINTTTGIFTSISGTANLGSEAALKNALNENIGLYSADYIDYYLVGLRDMAFAGVRSLPADTSNVKNRDAVSRRNKSSLIAADYKGFGDLLFKRLEAASETATQVLWKIPSQMIYYNKAALAFANKDTTLLTTNSSLPINTVRFQGISFLEPSVLSESTVTTNPPRGGLFKGDQFWAEWMQKWSTDTDINNKYRFNEADIDWKVENITTSTPFTLNLVNYTGRVGGYEYNTANNPTNTSWLVDDTYPWWFRPNDIKFLSTDKMIGTHHFNVDTNTLFSNASNFIPDPMDEYVFRIVCKKGITQFFIPAANSLPLKSAILLEYGFSDRTSTGLYSINSTLSSIFVGQNNYHDQQALWAYSRFDRSKVKVYVKKEAIERIVVSSVNEDRLVVTIGILVPRIKSIGYSKIFRNLNFSAGSDYPKQDSPAGADNEIDSGPWSFNLSYFDAVAGNDQFGADAAIAKKILDSGAFDIFPKTDDISGRNECAVKFTRAGLPSTLWIRMSILNTDGSAELLDSSGLISQVINE
jgi:hypothetical protein